MLRSTSRIGARVAPLRSLHASRAALVGKDVFFGVDGRTRMLAGVDKLADAVQVTS